MAQRMCSVDGCTSPVVSLGWCVKHYNRWRKNGTTDDPRPSREQRFMAKVDRSGECWLWTGFVMKKEGYGRFGVEGRKVALAHRWSYEHFVGPIPEGLELDHLCRVRRCVRPDHLEPVTHRENTLRGLAPIVLGTRQRAVTHCPKGHPYDGANTIYRKTGARRCRECTRMDSARRNVLRKRERHEARRSRRDPGVEVLSS